MTAATAPTVERTTTHSVAIGGSIGSPQRSAIEGAIGGSFCDANYSPKRFAVGSPDSCAIGSAIDDSINRANCGP